MTWRERLRELWKWVQIRLESKPIDPPTQPYRIDAIYEIGADHE